MSINRSIVDIYLLEVPFTYSTYLPYKEGKEKGWVLICGGFYMFPTIFLTRLKKNKALFFLLFLKQ